MKRVTRLSLIIASLMLIISVVTVFADTIPENKTNDTGFSNVSNYTNEILTNQPPENNITEKMPLSSWEFMLSLIVLGFGLLIIALETFIVFKFKGKIATSSVIQFIIVTLIITSALFLITAGYGNDQIAPAMGLLGTIAGYLLGRSHKEDKEEKAIETPKKNIKNEE